MSNIDTASYNRQGRMFFACNAGGIILTAVGTAVTGLAISNPFGSGKKVILMSATFAPTTVPAATYVAGLSVGFSNTLVTQTTPLSVYGADGSGVSTSAIAKAASSVTFPAATVLARIGGYAPTTPVAAGGIAWTDKVDGELILVPGAYCAIAMVGTAPTGISQISWIEVPV